MSQPPGWPAPDQQPYESYPVQPYPSSPYPEPPYQPAAPYPEPAYPDPAYPASAAPYQYQQPPPAYQPPYPAPVGWPAPVPPPPQPPRRTGLTVALISLIAVLVLAFAVGTWWAVNSITGEHDTVAIGDTTSASPDVSTPSAPATTSTPSAAATTPAGTAAVRLITPDTLANQPRITASSIQSYADQASAALANLPGATSTVAAFYGDVTSSSSVFGVIGAAAIIGNPKTALQTAFTSYGSGGSTITGIASTNPGPMGGYAQCGKTTSSGTSMSVCGWADDATLVMVMALGRTPTQCADLMRTVRATIEKRS